MKKQIIVGMAVILTAIFLYPSMASADHSHLWAPDDYRTKSIRDIYGAQQPKPTAQFAVSRSRNGELLDKVVSDAGNNLDLAFPVLDAYVGDELTFQDMSHGNGYSLIEWDWQWSGDIGEAVQKTTYDPLPDTHITLTEPGMTVFYLCVRSNVPVAPGIVDAWSDNGTHQTIGKNKWFPDGMYWYFTAVRVVVHPATEAQLVVRYWDAPANRLIHEGTVWPGTLLGEDAAIETSIQITDWEGYTFDRWRVVLPDGTEQYSGTEREVPVTLASFVPIKYINVECYPIQQGVTTNLTIREWDKATNQLLAEDNHPGETVTDGKEVTIFHTIPDKPGYQFTNYSITLPDGMIEQSGKERDITVILTAQQPDKILNIGYLPNEPISTPDSNGDEVEPGSSPSPPPTSEASPVPSPNPPQSSGQCDGVITWEEVDSHQVADGYDRYGHRIYRTCWHVFTYRATLTAETTTEPRTFKSGYGFCTEVATSMQTKLVGNNGCRSWGANRIPEQTIHPPEKATVYLPWTVTNRLGTQSGEIAMERSGSRFILPVNPISETGARKIYTDVSLPGTAEAPATHAFEIFLTGGGIDGEEWCLKLKDSITINGDMYSDDFSGAD